MIDYLQALVKSQLGHDVLDAAQIYSGNSRVFKLHCANEVSFIAKVYPAEDHVARDRLGAEFGALSFLWEQGIRAVPQPLYADDGHRTAIYSFIPGDNINTDRIGTQDIDAAVGFIHALADLRTHRQSVTLSDASEACFSHACHLDRICKRLQLLDNIGEETTYHTQARLLIQESFLPLFDRIKRETCRRLTELDIDPADELDIAYRTLSPSDFGFHNAIRRPDNRIVFVDFEYFGWDDPVKMIADFLQHPAQSISEPAKKRFLEQVIPLFNQDEVLEERLQLVYPILALKWCLIMLNEFLPSAWHRRKSAKPDLVFEEILEVQLSKARSKLEETRLLLESSRTDSITALVP